MVLPAFHLWKAFHPGTMLFQASYYRYFKMLAPPKISSYEKNCKNISIVFVVANSFTLHENFGFLSYHPDSEYHSELCY